MLKSTHFWGVVPPRREGTPAERGDGGSDEDKKIFKFKIPNSNFHFPKSNFQFQYWGVAKR
ncbi:hypothetical protein KKF38_02230 [Patescibacteria group bacterium]|nr:hypothetical protein [Patescibacteria group bacterium]